MAALSLAGVMLLAPSAYAHNAHKRVHPPTDNDVIYNQETVALPAVSVPEKFKFNKTRSRPGLLETKFLVADNGVCSSVAEFHNSKPGNDKIPENCCGHCQDVLVKDEIRIEHKSQDGYELLPWYVIFNLPETVIPARKQYYSIYRDRSPPTLLQSILKYRVLLV